MAKRSGKTQGAQATAGPDQAPEPIWYRENFGPGTHARSMASVVSIGNRADLETHLPAGATLVAVQPYGIDQRTGWWTHLVRAKLADGSIKTVGFTSHAV